MTKIDLSNNIPLQFSVTNESEVNSDAADFPGVDKALYEAFATRRAELLPFCALTENVEDHRDEHARLVLFAKMSYGLRKAGEAMSWALYHQKMCKIDKEKAKGVAALDEFGKWLLDRKNDGKESKATDKMRELYVSINDDVMRAAKREAFADAMVEQFSTIRSQFYQSISTIRAMCYGQKDSSYMSGASVNIER
jgi:hypothetical protein